MDQTRDSLVSCLVLSLALHVLMVLASYAAPELLRLYPNLLPAWLHDLLAHKPPAAEMTVNLPEARPDDPKVPDPVVTLTERMIVDPAMVSDVEPDKATHEGSDNALAANPNPVSSTKPVPNIPAPEREVRGTFDNYRPAPGGSKTREHSIDSPDVVPAPPVIQPVAPPPVAVVVPDLPKPVQVEEKPAPMTRKALEPLPEPPARPPGDLALAQPTPKPVTVTPAAPPKPAPPPTPAAPAAPAKPAIPAPAPPVTLAKATTATPTTQPAPPVTPVKPAPARSRPRRLSDVTGTGAGAEQSFRSKQEGGVDRRGVSFSYNVRASALGNYMSRLSTDIAHHWFRLLEDARFANERTGKVIVKFKLHPDGSVTNVMTESSDVGDLLSFFCESAIIEPAPYPRWPSELFDQHGKDPIEITFTFTYL